MAAESEVKAMSLTNAKTLVRRVSPVPLSRSIPACLKNEVEVNKIIKGC